MHGLQNRELPLKQEQEGPQGPLGNAKVLQRLQEAPIPQGNQVTRFQYKPQQPLKRGLLFIYARFIMDFMVGIFEPVAATPKPKRPVYVLPKTVKRSRLAFIVIVNLVFWLVPFAICGYFISYHLWPYMVPTMPRLVSHIFYILTLGMGLIWGLMSGFRLMRQVIQAGVASGEVKVVDPNESIKSKNEI